MNRTEKQEFVEEFNQTLNRNNFLLITHYKGLSVEELSLLRKQVKEKNAFFKVTKNSLVKRAIKNTNFERLDHFFIGPTAVAYSNDPVSAAKVVYDFSKENENLKIIAGSMGENELSLDEIKTLASLPSMDELRGKIIGLLISPLSNIVSLMKEPSSKVVRLLNSKFKNENN